MLAEATTITVTIGLTEASIIATTVGGSIALAWKGYQADRKRRNDAEDVAAAAAVAERKEQWKNVIDLTKETATATTKGAGILGELVTRITDVQDDVRSVKSSIDKGKQP